MQIFISRDLYELSAFYQILAAKGFVVKGQSLVRLRALPFLEVPPADWIFFSSQHAVAFFFQTLTQGHFEFPDVKWAALGKATAVALIKHTEMIQFTGTGDPVDSAELFLPLCEGQTVLFPGARHSRQSFRRLIEAVAQIIHLDVYDNAPIGNPPEIGAEVLVFTSPMNAQAYFSKYHLQSGQKTIAIGQTTAAALQELGISDVRIAAEPTEKALAEAVISLQG